MKLFFYDLETTGLNPARHGIHQISGLIEIDGVTKETFNFYVQPNPKAQIDEAALQVAHVTRQQIMAYPPMREVHHQLIEMLSKYVDRYDKTDKFFLVGYNNAAFDNQFLSGFFKQNDDPYLNTWFWSGSIDVMVLSTQHLMQQRPKMENFKLATVAKYLGIEVTEEKLHGADYDIYLTKAIYDKLTRK